VQYLEMHEHRPHLEKALKESKKRLMIVSPWIRAIAVNSLFLQWLEDLLRRDVQVHIGYGFGGKDKNCRDIDSQAEAKLKELARRYPETFILQRWGDTHAKILISDSQFSIITSFNWLSFKGASNRMFRDERGTLVSDSRKVDELYNRLLVRFSEERCSELVPHKKKVIVHPKPKKLVLKDVSKPKPQIVRVVHQ
jgi:phosphatidylserine/phosphatidylglycerophosphate/cardiolipin synthase-like enzyme